jgi:5-methyltetrahydrofolate--homocysteine methyltransferase
MIGTILEKISEKGILVSDGGMGTFLQTKGLQSGTCPEYYSISNPEIISEYADSFRSVGADIIQTNTFGASALKLSDFGREKECDTINRESVRIARETVDDLVFIAGSIGPSGKLLSPHGNTAPETMFDSFLQQSNALISEGVDLIIIETMIDLEEALLALQSARRISSTIPITVSMMYTNTPSGFYTIMGNSLEECLQRLSDNGCDIHGSNCGNGIQDMIEIAKSLKIFSSQPVLIQANAGKPEIKESTVIYPESPENFYNLAEQLIQTGVSVIGGCCGTDYDHIKSIRKAVDSFIIKDS